MTAVMKKLPLLILLFLLGACDGSNDASSTPVRDVVILDLSMINGRPPIDPQKTDTQDSLDLAENLFIGLTNYNHQTNSIDPEFAQSWTISDDGLTWTFDLRQDVFWVQPTKADGNETAVIPIRPVTADDIVFALQRTCTRSTGTPDAFIYFVIQGCRYLYENPLKGKQTLTDHDQLLLFGAKAIDDHTLAVSLNTPGSNFLSMTSSPAFTAVPRDLVEEYGDDAGVEGKSPTWNSVEEAVYSGAFIIAPTSTKDRTILHRNPEWKLPPRIDIVEKAVKVVNIWHYESEAIAFQQWQKKQLDISPLPADQRETMLESKPNNVLLLPEQTLFYLGFNMDSPALGDETVRQALSAALDREAFVLDLYNGRAIPMRHLIPPGLVGSLLADQTGIGYNPDYARQQMAASSFRACRLMPPITILVSSADLSLRVAELARDMWVEELGCKTDQIIIEQASLGQLLATTVPDNEGTRPDLWELGWTAHYPDADNWMHDLLHCSDGQNREKRPCTPTDTLIKQAAMSMNIEERQGIYRQIENQFFGETGSFPIAPLYLPGTYRLAQSWVTEYHPALFGGEQYDSYILDPVLKRLERSREEGK